MLRIDFHYVLLLYWLIIVWRFWAIEYKLTSNIARGFFGCSNTPKIISYILDFKFRMHTLKSTPNWFLQIYLVFNVKFFRNKDSFCMLFSFVHCWPKLVNLLNVRNVLTTLRRLLNKFVTLFTHLKKVGVNSLTPTPMMIFPHLNSTCIQFPILTHNLFPNLKI